MSPNGTISHRLNNYKAKISSQGIEPTVLHLPVSGLPMLEQAKQGI